MVKTEIEKFIASKDVTVVEAMKLIDINTHGIIYIADENRKLTGSQYSSSSQKRSLRGS